MEYYRVFDMRYLVIYIVLAMASVTTAQAQFTGETNVHTISEIKKMSDDTKVIAEGYITRRVGDEEYTFTDDTGEIRIEIDDDLWQGREVDSETPIRIYGELDKKWFRSSEIEVDRFEFL